MTDKQFQELQAKIVRLEEAVEMLVRYVGHHGDDDHQTRMSELGFGDPPMKRSDGG